MTQGRVAIFGSCNEAYAPYMATSLRSFIVQDPKLEHDYFVLGRRFSNRTRSMLDSHGIGYVPIDLAATFASRGRRNYPSECFWIFKGPELFAARGYDFSLAVDGDVWCNRKLDFESLARVKHLGGIDRGATVATFLTYISQFDQLVRVFETLAANASRRATNSGVLFFRNTPLAELGFFAKFADIYRRSEAHGIPRAGDDSTLALLLGVDRGIHLETMDASWNVYRGLDQRFTRRDPRYQTHMSEFRRGARIVHLSYTKPWRKILRYPNAFSEIFASRWRQLYQSTAGHPRRRPTVVRRPSARRTTGIPRRDPGKVVCYWYRGTRPNFGDELAPFLIGKLLKLPESTGVAPPPKHPNQLRAPVLLSVGSILRLSCSNTVCWGPGIRNIDQPVARSAKFCAVRGPLTQERLSALGFDCPEVYGDPGLLLPEFYRPSTEKKYRLGVIAHAVDTAHLRRHYGQEPDTLVIDLATSNVTSVIDKIAACEATVSSALHGLVTSVAYGVPTRWIRCSDKIMGDGSKFLDFFTSLQPELLASVDRRSVRLVANGPSSEAFRAVPLERKLPVDELIQTTNQLPGLRSLASLREACPIDHRGWKNKVSI